MMSRWLRSVSAACASLACVAQLQGCVDDPAPPPIDGGASVDAPDVPTLADVAPADTPAVVDGPTVVDAPDVPAVTDPCAPGAVIDLNRVASREGGVYVYQGSNAGAPASQVWAPRADCVPAGRVIRSVAHRFVVSAPTNLLVTAEGAAGLPHDIALYVHNGCTPLTPAQFCGTTTFRSPQAGNIVSRIPAGTTVWIIVSSIAKSDGDPGAPYSLRLVERPVQGLGEACDNLDLLCGTGLGCVFPTGESVGACAADGAVVGARCRSAAPQCDGDLACVGSLCLRRVAAGGRCVPRESTCQSNGRCALDEPGWAGGTCPALGTVGSTCTATAPCTDGSTCAGSVSGYCQRIAALNEPCLLDGSVTCGGGASCVLVTPPGEAPSFRCAADGSAAGTSCAAAEPRCAAGLRCSAERGRGWCRAPATDRCDPRLASDCGDGRVCAITAPGEGRCVAWTRESSAFNDTVPAAEAARVPPFAVRGALLPSGDQDCYLIDQRAPGRLVYQVHDGTGACTAATALTAFTTPDRPRVSTFPDGCLGSLSTNNALRRPAGRYVVCVLTPSNFLGALDYVFTVTAEP